MKFIPDYRFRVIAEEEYTEKIRGIIEQLDRCRNSGFFSSFDGNKLFYEYFLAENSRGAVVIVHGLSEFTQKYYEFAYYLLNQGYDVFVYDQRGHGHSCRLTEQRDLIHVDKFTDYVTDLDRFIADVVSPVTENKPLYLYGHSMGGAVVALYLAKHPEVFRKAVMSAPMIEPLTGDVSPFVARVGLSLYLIFGNGKSRFWRTNDFNPDHKFENSDDRSLARFTRHMELRRGDKDYQTTPLSMRWIQQSVSLRPKLAKARFGRRIRTPILMLSAEQDKVVNTQAQADFAENCPACEHVVMKGAAHALLNGQEPTVTEYVQRILDHFV